MLGRLKVGRSALSGWTLAAMLGVMGFALGGTASASALPSNCVQSGTTVTCSFAYSGAEQTLSLPAGVSQVSITAVGAPGGEGGGNGADVGAVVPLPAGTTTLYVEVGGAGTSGGGFNGGGNSGSGGGGGGASDVRTCSSSVCQLSSNDTRLVVAGGGGGATAHACPPQTTTPAGQAGDSTVTGAGAGGDGSDSCPFAGGAGGNGGFGGTAGGQGGSGTPLFPCDGGSGSLGQGGSDPTTCDSGDVGGGGGGGYWGGGAGGDGNDVGGGGGAGSSYWVPDATGTSMTEDTTGTPQVVISYTAPTTGQADLSLTNRAGLNPAIRGHKLTYTIKPTNTGTATANGVTLTDSLPASVRFVSVTDPNRCKHSGGQNGMGGTVTCNFGSFEAGKQATIELAVTPTKVGPLSDTAKVTATGVTPDADDTATAKTEVKSP